MFFDAGIGGWSLHWLTVVRQVAASGVRACAYDRAGTGLSESGPTPRTSTRISEELGALIEATSSSAPLVLVGHSFGGQNVRLFASRHPERVRALVLVESGHEEQWGRLPAEMWSAVQVRARQLRQLSNTMKDDSSAAPQSSVDPDLSPGWQKAASTVSADPRHYLGVALEMEAMAQSVQQLAATSDLGDLPLLVLTAGRSMDAYRGAPFDLEAAGVVWDRLQRDLLTLSTHSRQVVHGQADHRLPTAHPGFVASEIIAFLHRIATENDASDSCGE